MKPVIQKKSPGFSSSFKAYFPIFLIFFYLLLVVSLLQFHEGRFDGIRFMGSFMAGFFLVFSFFKFLNLKGFAEVYGRYDWVAKKFPVYGLVYPFLEFALGLSYLLGFAPFFTNCVTFVIMLMSSGGVLQNFLSKNKVCCACLGAVLNVPISGITLFENLMMVVMSGMLLWILP